MNTKKNLVTNVIYNTYGTFFYFFCQWSITVLVVRISGYHDAGVLSLIISTTNLFYCIALFGVRNYQVSDVVNKYSDNDYIYARLITVGLSMVCFLVSLIFLGFNQETIGCCIIYIFYKIAESFSDVFFGSFQKYDDYKKIAISYTLKGILTVSSFALVLMMTQNLAITLCVNAILYILVLLLYDLRNLSMKFKVKLKKFEFIKLLKVCFPLMLYSCMVPYLNFITRYIIEKNYGTEILGYYSSVTMVFVVMSTLMGSVFVSVIPKIAFYYNENKFNKLKKTLCILLLMIFGFAIVACVFASIIGDFVFSLIFGSDILMYMYLLIPTIIASIVLTIVSLLSSVLISFRMNKSVLYCNIVAVILCTLTVFLFVNWFGPVGTLYSLVVSLTASAVLLAFCIIYNLKNKSVNITIK